jgi:branched-chain amino acid transport system substrate-binding protein
MTRSFAQRAAALLGFGLVALSSARAEPCHLSIGVVMELTGTAGAYGQAAAKAIEMAFSDLNAAGGVRGCPLVADTRDSQSQASIAVDAANQLVQLDKVPVIISGISSVTIPVLQSVTGPAKVLQASPSASSPRLTELARDGRSGRYFFRTITSDALQGTAAARFAWDLGIKRIAIIYVNNDFGTLLQQAFVRAYRGLGGTVVIATPYNERQGSFAAEVSTTLAGKPDALYLISTPVEGASIARAWIAQGGTRRLLLNDGMNSDDFIRAVGARYLNEAYGTSSGTTPTESTRYFEDHYRHYAKLDPSSPAADRAYDLGVLIGLAAAATPHADGPSIRAALSRVTDPQGTVVHAGPAEFTKAIALLRAGKTVRYEGVIGAVEVDTFGDIRGPFRLWKIKDGSVTTVGMLPADNITDIGSKR